MYESTRLKLIPMFIHIPKFSHSVLIFVAVTCKDTGSPSNGGRSGDDFTFGNTVSFKCDPGYKITGSRNRTCTASGTWSGIQPTCTGNHTFSPPRH